MPLWFTGADGERYKWAAPTNKKEFAQRLSLMGLILSPNTHPRCVEKRHTAPLDVAWSIYTATDHIYGTKMPWAVVKGSRGLSGKSTIMAAVTTLEGLEGISSTLLGGSFAQSKNVHDISDAIWDRDITLETGEILEKGLAHLVDDPTASETKFFTGATRKALTASQNSVRGPHRPRLRLDEIDEMSMEILEAALGQPMSVDEDIPIQTVMASTHQHADGTMTKIMKRARERGWPVYEYCYLDCLRTEDRYMDVWKGTRWGDGPRDPNDKPDGLEGGWLPMSLVLDKRLGVSEMTWQTEYELGEPSPEGRAFMTDAVHAAFIPGWPLGPDLTNTVPLGGLEGDYYEFACCEKYFRTGIPCRNHVYATGADWAKTTDWTIIATYRTDTGGPWQMVAWERLGRRNWKVMLGRFDIRIARFPGYAAHDATSMGGSMASDFLSVDALGVTLAGRVRDTIFEDYVVAIENGDLLAPRIDFLYDEHRYCTVADLMRGGRAKGGHPPDSVVASALAWSLRGDIIPLGLIPGGGDQPSIMDGLV